MSKGVYGVRNPKTVTLTPALVQWLADCQNLIEELQPIPLRSMVLPRLVQEERVPHRVRVREPEVGQDVGHLRDPHARLRVLSTVTRFFEAGRVSQTLYGVSKTLFDST